MHTRLQKHLQASSLSTSTAVPNPFQSRPFAVQTKPEQSSPQKQETPDLEEQGEKVKPVGYSLANISITPPKPPSVPSIQLKLAIKEPGNKYEQEADRVAAEEVSQSHALESLTLQRQQIEEQPLQMKPLADSITRFKIQRKPKEHSAFSAEEAKKVKERWDTDSSYTVSDTGDQRETKEYYKWKTKANKVLGELTKKLGKPKADEILIWITKYEAHELWAVRSAGTEPEKPEATPTELATAEIKEGKTLKTLGNAPSPAYRKVQQYDVKLPDQQGAYSFKDNPVKPSYKYLTNETGVAKSGHKLAARKDADEIFKDAGITDETVKKVMKKVSTEEGGFEAVNTYDTGYVSVGFIQFISGKSGAGSLLTLLSEMKKSAPADFTTYFHNLGIDVDSKGLVVVDPATGKQLRGEAAVEVIMNDKRLTAAFHNAGLKARSYQVAQVKIAYAKYYLALKNFTVKTENATISGIYGDVLKSEAGKAAIMDRAVQRGPGDAGTGAAKVFKDTCIGLIKKHKLTKLEDLAKYEIELIPSLRNRIDVLKEKDLSQPSPAPTATAAQKVQPQVQKQEEQIQNKLLLQQAVDSNFNASSNIESQINSSKGRGSALADEVRSFMEPRFATNFSQVRVHTDGEAVQMNRQLSAQAFTHGRDIYFGDLKYNPGSSEGKRLLAHELTHVVQQTGSVQRQLSIQCAKKKDIKEVEAIADEFKMSPEARRDFGDFLEDEKATGNGGTKNERGDFTYSELRQKACEFLDLNK